MQGKIKEWTKEQIKKMNIQGTIKGINKRTVEEWGHAGSNNCSERRNR